MSCKKPLVESFLDTFIGHNDFPCVGAKTALAKNNITANCYGDLLGDDNIIDILGDIYNFVDEVNLPTDMYSSFICVFDKSHDLDEAEFDSALWAKLQSLHELDCRLHSWDKQVSSNPDDEHFSFSLGNHGFFVIGLNPLSSRKSRQFEYPALVFNLHEQFDYLREKGRFEGIKETIRKRDEIFSGSRNPMLADHGDSSEVYQYSGKHLKNDWQCPLKIKA